jgi:hypothetical protein
MTTYQKNMKTYQIRYQHTSWATAPSAAAAILNVKNESGVSRLYYADCADGMYCYLTAADKAADDTGASAYAVICDPNQQID